MSDPSLIWSLKPFNKLTINELYKILQLRSEVFVVEQTCVYQDIDGYDDQCFHLLGFAEIDGETEIVAYLRIVPPGIKYTEASLGRVVVKASCRKFGYGKKLIAQSLKECKTALNYGDVRISAQKYLERFYTSFGFSSVGDIYDEDGIPHIEMLRVLPN